jgi:hypothetical protein
MCVFGILQSLLCNFLVFVLQLFYNLAQQATDDEEEVEPSDQHICHSANYISVGQLIQADEDEYQREQ